MNLYENNTEALIALENGDFLTAQKIFRENCNCGDPRALNNFGFFCLENGVTQRNGKNISGTGYGKRYIKKAYEQQKESRIILSNMALIAAQYEKNYESAVGFYQEAYHLEKSQDLLYNMGVCLYQLKCYRDVISLLKDQDLSATDLFLLYSFSELQEDKAQFDSLIEKHDVRNMGLDADVVLVLLYLCNKGSITQSDVYSYLENWSPDEYMWAVSIDVLIQNNISTQAIKTLIEKKTEGYADKNRVKKSALHFLNSQADRQVHIDTTIYYHPELRDMCGYFGCLAHHTEW